MNRNIGVIASAVNLVAVICFALSMLFHFNFGGYFSSIFIAFSFIPMMCAYGYFSKEKTKLEGITSVGFATVYVTVILLVYFARLTTVRFGGLTKQTTALLDFQQFGLLFNYDLLGYGLMALATFFAELTVEARSKADKWLKGLLLVHGIFFFSCLIVPMLGVFSAGGKEWIGIAVLEFWCVYFVPISVLSCKYFIKCGN